MAYKDKEKARAYQRKWHEENKDRLKAIRKTYYEKTKVSNAEKRLAYRKKWLSQPDVVERQTRLRHDRTQERRQLICDIQLSYGCQNPECLWSGDYLACDLDYHHLDPETKYMQVSQMASCSMEQIASEMNKCVVLCAICHRRYHAGHIELTPNMKCNVTVSDGSLITG